MDGWMDGRMDECIIMFMQAYVYMYVCTEAIHIYIYICI